MRPWQARSHHSNFCSKLIRPNSGSRRGGMTLVKKLPGPRITQSAS
ncbi:Uncharacterised protein [Vibrio cholerae]|nr:Uncharacterised protein [Vibrio cholerae]